MAVVHRFYCISRYQPEKTRYGLSVQDMNLKFKMFQVGKLLFEVMIFFQDNHLTSEITRSESLCAFFLCFDIDIIIFCCIFYLLHRSSSNLEVICKPLTDF